MAKLIQRLLAGVLASAAITGGTAAYVWRRLPKKCRAPCGLT